MCAGEQDVLCPRIFTSGKFFVRWVGALPKREPYCTGWFDLLNYHILQKKS